MREHVAATKRGGSFAEQGDLTTAPAGSAVPAGLVESTSTPVVDVRIALFTVAAGRLNVALLDRLGAGYRLPRGRPTPPETLDADARTIVREGTGLREQYLEQLYTLSVDDHTRWTVIVAYLALIWSDREPAPALGGNWFDVETLPALSAADRMVIDYAVLRLRAKIGYTTIAFHLLPPTFTLRELQATYETILRRRLDKRNFRRRVIAAGFLEPTGDKRREGSHRPAVVYRFGAAHDRETYLTPPWAAEQ